MDPPFLRALFSLCQQGRGAFTSAPILLPILTGGGLAHMGDAIGLAHSPFRTQPGGEVSATQNLAPYLRVTSPPDAIL